MVIQDSLSKVEVAMARDENVVVARVMEPWIPVGVVVHSDLEPAGLDGVEIFRRIVVIVKVDDHVAMAPRVSRVRGATQK
jgi:hypothetical protein